MDKRLEKNTENVLNLKKFLIEITQNPKEILQEIPSLIEVLKNQATLAKYQDAKRAIIPSSLNTIKRIANRFIENGFEEIERLRVLAIQAVNKELNKPIIVHKINKEDLKNTIKEDKIKQEKLKKLHLVLLNQVMEDLNTFDKISSTNDLELIKEISKRAKQRIQSLGTKTAELVSLVNSGKQSPFKLVKDGHV